MVILAVQSNLIELKYSSNTMELVLIGEEVGYKCAIYYY